MRVLYLDCFSGISGDMTLGALISLGADTQYLKAELSKLGIDDEYCLTCKEINSYGITGVSVDVILKDVQKTMIIVIIMTQYTCKILLMTMNV